VHICILQGYEHLESYDNVFWHIRQHQVQEAIRGSGDGKTSISEGVEASVIYVRFKAAASEVCFSI